MAVNDLNLMLNVPLQIFVGLSEVLELSDQLFLKTDDFVFIEHLKLTVLALSFRPCFTLLTESLQTFPTRLAKIEVTLLAASVRAVDHGTDTNL